MSTPLNSVAPGRSPPDTTRPLNVRSRSVAGSREECSDVGETCGVVCDVETWPEGDPGVARPGGHVRCSFFNACVHAGGSRYSPGFPVPGGQLQSTGLEWAGEGPEGQLGPQAPAILALPELRPRPLGLGKSP